MSKCYCQTNTELQVIIEMHACAKCILYCSTATPCSGQPFLRCCGYKCETTPCHFSHTQYMQPTPQGHTEGLFLVYSYFLVCMVSLPIMSCSFSRSISVTSDYGKMQPGVVGWCSSYLQQQLQVRPQLCAQTCLVSDVISRSQCHVLYNTRVVTCYSILEG